jgi:hypothetical protein
MVLHRPIETTTVTGQLDFRCAVTRSYFAEGRGPRQPRLNAGDEGAADVGEGGVGEPSAQLLNNAAIRVSVSSTN